MLAIEIMQRLHSMGIQLSIHGDNILAEPKSAITDDARQLIRSHKIALLTELQVANDDPKEAAREAAEERAAILEYDGGLSHSEVEKVAVLAEDFYSHLFGVAKVTGCCYARGGRYCAEGEHLRNAYYQAVRGAGINVH